MQDIEKLKAVYEEKEAKYQALCKAAGVVYEAHQAIKALCDEAMADMQEAGVELIDAMKAQQ